MGGLVLLVRFFIPDGGLDGGFGVFGEVAVEGVVALVASITEKEALRGQALLGPFPLLVHKAEDLSFVPIYAVLPVVIELHTHLHLGAALRQRALELPQELALQQLLGAPSLILVVFEQTIQHFLDLFVLQILIKVLDLLLVHLEVGQYLGRLGGFEGLDLL